ncbi:hypothetical protein FSP39_017057 [Pinctada imbricata]|uniref:Uncharacterized protein n=1 Tax=Pinctada imbricata TaxID=66713 RepID=A0AA89BXM5_PINIB|nr:hypothetical protein FSP39_017057 [Pinctada imbricata]
MDAVSKPRRKGARLPKAPFKDLSVRDAGREKVFLAESRSDTSEKILPEGLKLENTYRMEPDEGKRFVSYKVEGKMTEILGERLADVDYSDATGSTLSTELATQIKKELHQFPWNRYKYVVQVVIGEHKEQDVKIGSRCLWNQKTDNFACANYSNKSLFAVAACFAIYFD